jgi:fructose-bisphosphate aldolase class II
MEKVSYKDIGLVTTTEMFAKAMKGKYAIPAYNFNNMEQLQAIVMGCVESKSPFILQVSSGARKYATRPFCGSLPGAVGMINDAHRR